MSLSVVERMVLDNVVQGSASPEAPAVLVKVKEEPVEGGVRGAEPPAPFSYPFPVLSPISRLRLFGRFGLRRVERSLFLSSRVDKKLLVYA